MLLFGHSGYEMSRWLPNKATRLAIERFQHKLQAVKIQLSSLVDATRTTRKSHCYTDGSEELHAAPHA